MSAQATVQAQTIKPTAATVTHGMLQRAAVNSSPVGEVPPIVHEVLRSSGQPLDSQTRASMEPRFGRDFSKVRVHTDSRATEAAQSISAKAYTVGEHIVFAKERYTPYEEKGSRLIAHELAHVVQQAHGSAGSAESLEREAELAETGMVPTVHASMLPRPQLQLSPERAIRLIIIRLGNGSRANFILERDEGEPLPASGTAENLTPGEYQISWNAGRRSMDIRAADGSEMSEASRAYVNIPRTAAHMLQLLRMVTEPIPMEVRSGEAVVPEVALGEITEPSEVGDQQWTIAELPERIREFLFSETAIREFRPRDYPTILRITQKLMELSDSELEAYRARTVSTTSDLTVFETSIDRYIVEVHQRRHAAQERERLKTRLSGLEELYQQYKDYTAMERNRTHTPSQLEHGIQGPSPIRLEQGSQAARASLESNLQRHGFSSISEFEQLIRDFGTAFRNETVLIARDMLDRTEHFLSEQERRYQNPAESLALFTQLNRSQARRHYEEAERQQSRMDMILPDPDLHRYTPGESQMRGRAQQRRDDERQQAEAEVAEASQSHPLIAIPDFGREALARASQSEVQPLLLEYVRDRRSKVQETRRNLTTTPDMVFELDTLLQAAYQEQDINPDSIYDMIIRDHTHDLTVAHAAINLAVAVLAIAAGLLSAGSGTVAVLGAATAAGIGAYQALEEFRRYERLSAAHGAQLLSDDPSFAWVVVAVVGAALDLTVAGSVLQLPGLRSAVQAFNSGDMAGDLAAFGRQLNALTDIPEPILINIRRAAAVEAEARAAWRSFLPDSDSVLYSAFAPLERTGWLLYAAYRNIQRGYFSFERFVMTQEAVDLIGDVARLTPEELTSLRSAIAQAIADAQNIARHGHSLGMSENEIEAFFRMGRNRPGMTAEQVIREMDAWRATRQSGIPFGFQSADQFAEFRATAQAELRRLDPNAEAFLQGSSVSGISYDRKVPFDVESDLDVAISSRTLFNRARAERFPVLQGPNRIELTDELLAELRLTRFRNRLSRVISSEFGEAAAEASGPARRINFLLFENERAVRQPLRGSTETTRATIPLR